MRLARSGFCIFLACALAAGSAFAASERIESFHSDIRIDDDGAMRVTETITVYATGRRIQRGIYRDFPTSYKDRHGNRYRVTFDVIRVLRNGHPEPFHVEGSGNGVRVYVGDADRYVDPGQHVYAITYDTSRQLGFFADHDELYWNVTGNEWDFPIDRASATVTLPLGVPPEQLAAEGYTGAAGSRARNLDAAITGPGTADYVTTTKLGPHEGLTIVMSWPKGVIAEPTATDRAGYLLADNAHLVAALIGGLALLGYYLLAWSAVGRDPERGVLVARYEPPPGYSPASMRYISEMGYDKKCFTAAILNLAVKGYLTIDEDDGDYSLVQTGNKVEMAPGEQKLADALFDGRSRIELKNSNHEAIGDALDKHEQSLSMDFENKYFMTNRGYFILGIALSVAIAVITLLFAPPGIDIGTTLFLIIWSTIWWTGTGAGVYRAWVHFRHGSGITSRIGSAVRLLFLVPFVLAGLFVLYPIVQFGATSMVLVIAALVVMNLAFYHLLKAPTLLGRSLLDKVEGFRHYIEVAEQSDLDVRYPEGRTPALFERFLPYAVALGIEQNWAEHFTSVMAAASAGADGYSPVWYHGTHWHAYNLTGFSSSLSNSFTSAAAASASPPGSSSGGGGGGFSGGGGGGGGGGGW